MTKQHKAKRDDEEQSKRFIEMAHELGAETSDEKFERVFKKVIPARSTKPKKTLTRR